MEIFLSSLSHTVKLEKIILSNSIYFGNVDYLGILPASGAGDHVKLQLFPYQINH